jgi:hypothetical protein
MRQIIYCVMLVAIWLCSMASAHAQCADTDKIYIDPRLVPKPINCSPQRLEAIMLGMASNPRLSEMGQGIILQCRRQAQNQPIRIPYGSGVVLVSPTNPCIQQYIP